MEANETNNTETVTNTQILDSLTRLTARVAALEAELATFKGAGKAPKVTRAPKVVADKPARTEGPKGVNQAINWTLELPTEYKGGGIYGRFDKALRATGKTTFTRLEAVEVAKGMGDLGSKTAPMLAADFKLVLKKLADAAPTVAPVAATPVLAPVLEMPVEEPKVEEVTETTVAPVVAPVLDITPKDAPVVAEAPKAGKGRKNKAANG